MINGSLHSTSEKSPSSPTDVDVAGEFSTNSIRSLTRDHGTELDQEDTQRVTYRLYKRRFAGVVALVFLNIVAAMVWPWFGPISNNMANEFKINLDQVNWLGNIVAIVYLPGALLVPMIISRHGIRRCCDLGAIALIISAWIRYAGTARSLSSGSAYALLFIGQFIGALAQPIYQVIGTKYSETWFDLKGRTTATMIIGISNPFGGALGQLLSPLVGDTRQSILILGILTTAIAPLVFLIGDAPPTPPTYSASKKPPSLGSLSRAMLGLEVERDAYMSTRERFDFAIISLIFGVLVGASNSFAILSAQVLQPVGYSADESGFMGACLLLTGMVAAIITAPLFDRVFTHHLAITSKILVPCVAVGWLSLIWAVRPHNAAGLFIIMTIIGVGSITMIPVGMELACEVTRNPDGSGAIVWFAGNLMGVVFILSEGALRAGPDASPPLNMKRSLIFAGVIVLVGSLSVFLLRGHERRKEMDKEKMQEAAAILPELNRLS